MSDQDTNTSDIPSLPNSFFAAAHLINLSEVGINEHQATEFRAQLAPFAKEWESPEMSIYDDYDAAKDKLTTIVDV